MLERKVEWQNIEALLKETNKILVHDILTEMEEELDFRCVYSHVYIYIYTRIYIHVCMQTLTLVHEIRILK